MLVKNTKKLFALASLVLPLWQGYCYARNMPQPKFIETFKYAFVYGVEQVAQSVGEYQAWHQLIRQSLSRTRVLKESF